MVINARYVALKEKNTILSDIRYVTKQSSRPPDFTRLISLKKTMARILTVISERKKVRENYRKHLEDEYVEEQQKHLVAKIEELKGTQEY